MVNDSLQQVTAEENVMECPECGGTMETEGDERFCRKCGFVLE